MIFSDEVFTPEPISESRTRLALCTVAERAAAVVHPSDLLAAVVLQPDVSLGQVLATSLRPTAKTDDLVEVAERQFGRAIGVPSYPRTRASFSPAALEVLDTFDALCRTHADLPAGASLELLLWCILPHLSEQERRAWAILDLEAIAVALQRRLEPLAAKIAVTPQPNEADSEEQPAILADIAPSDDLTRRARLLPSDQPGPLDGEPAYETLFDRLARALHRSDSHALLVGDRGVGQSTILAELARRAARGPLPTLRGKRIFVADCRHTAPEQSRQRLMALLAAVAQHEDLVVCLEGFASLLRTDRGGTNKELLLSILPQVRAKLIGLVSPRDYEELVADDADMADRFIAVEAPEPEPETAIRLLSYYSAGLEDRYAVEIEPDAIRQAVVFTDRYILNERLPGKALKVLRQVCEDLAYDRAQSAGDRRRITDDDVVRAVSQASGVPEETLRGVAERGDYEERLAQEIFGQEHAVREVATELGLIKAGLTDPDKPASVMLFVGQTGTGKTEMAKVLAQFYSRSKRLRTYTLGNFVEAHSVAGIIGVPPGYVGHEQGGRIVSDLAADPYCVFLLDEADKAHPDVLQPFLNLFDEGWISDQRGVRAYADKAIFILTTNVGQRMLADMARDKKTPEEMAARMKEALAQIRHGKSNRPVFAPEFLARIKRVIVFQPLGQEAMAGICRKHLRQMQAAWREKRQKGLVVPEPLLEYVAAESHHRNEKTQGREGGRIVRKLMAELIEAPIQRAATAQPAAYRACQAVVLEARFAEPQGSDPASPPGIGVVFQQEQETFPETEKE